MKSVLNKTRRPLRIPLPGGKTLHLGLAATGQVPDEALDRPAVRKMIESGEIEVFEQDRQTLAAETGSSRINRSPQGHPAARDSSRRGDR